VDVQAVAAWLVGLVAGLTALGWLVRKVFVTLRKIGHFIDDVSGEPARYGVAARPSLMDRITALEGTSARVQHEVTHNGGGSLKDAVARIEQRVNEHVAMPHNGP
jgi:hypothetical protein